MDDIPIKPDNDVKPPRGWNYIEDWKWGRDPTKVCGWNTQHGVAEFIHHDDGWTIASFNGQVKRSEPSLWRPMPDAPTFKRDPAWFGSGTSTATSADTGIRPAMIAKSARR